jgi:hypothetical protein
MTTATMFLRLQAFIDHEYVSTLQMLKAMGQQPQEEEEDPEKKEHRFWKTQPVPGFGK